MSSQINSLDQHEIEQVLSWLCTKSEYIQIAAALAVVRMRIIDVSDSIFSLRYAHSESTLQTVLERLYAPSFTLALSVYEVDPDHFAYAVEQEIRKEEQLALMGFGVHVALADQKGKRMQNKILALFHTVIPYVKELRAMAGSMEGCILMQQLDYWFSKKPEGYYKFLEPVQSKGIDENGKLIPGHRLYRPGDSWCEELNCSPHEFRRMFDALGVRWKSKGEFMNADDPFCGRGYCSFVDRKQNLTYYFRNHAVVDAFLDRLATDGTQSVSTSGKRSTELQGWKSQPSIKVTSLIQKLQAQTITTTTTEGIAAGINYSTKNPIWQDGEAHGSLNEFISSAFWMESITGEVLNPAGFIASIRKRISDQGPNTEDWGTLVLWRASQTNPPSTANPEDT